MLDCTSEIAYQGVSADGRVEVLKVGVGGKYEDRAIRQVGDAVAQYVAIQTRLCREYNAEIITAAAYHAEAKAIRERLNGATTFAREYANAGSEQNRLGALDKLVQLTVPAASRENEVELGISVLLELPAALGGGRSTLRPGGQVPTGSRMTFEVSASAETHLYVFQRAPTGEVSVLFPSNEISVPNPIRGGVALVIPGDGRAFVVDDKDLGVEDVYVVASRTAVPAMQSSLAAIAAGQVARVQQDDALTQLAAASTAGKADSSCAQARGVALEPGPGASGCVRPRGILLERKGVDRTLSVRTEPGDGLIARTFSFRHVSASSYKSGAL